MTGVSWAGTDPDHVVYVCLDPGVPVFGRKGCSVHVQSVLRELLARGARVDLVASRTGGPAPRGLEGVRVHELGRPRAESPAAVEALRTAQDEHAAELVAGLLRATASRAPLVYQRYSLFSARVMETAAELGVPGILEVNAPLVEEQARHRVLVDGAGARSATVRALRAAHLAYAVSGPVAAWAEALLGDGGEVRVVPNGVDVARFASPAEAGDRGTAAVPDPLTLAFVGTFRPWHGVDLLVDAVARLGGEHRVRLLLIGDGPERTAVLARAVERGVAVAAPGAVDPDAVPGLLAGADVAVAPYPEGEAYFSPLKVMEYLAAGLPTVAGAVSDLPRLLTDGAEVLLVPPGDLDALTLALRRLVADDGLRRRLSRAGRQAAERRLTWQAAVGTVLEASAARSPALAAGPVS